MTDEKPRRPPAGKLGGDKPMRRRPAASDARAPSGERKPFARGADKPESEKLGAEKPRFEKRAPERPHKKPRVERPAPTPRTTAFEGERIAKVMARAGACSRRDAEAWIAAGRVAVNGRVLNSPAFNVKEGDRIEIDGAPMQARERTRLFLFHKPAGLVTTARDDEGRPTVFAFLEERHADLPRVVSVGRLDINTEGLLLLTNDGGLARTLELPATGWMRRYRVRAHGDIDQARLDELRVGVTIEGVHYAPIEARLERMQGSNAWIAMSLNEGKNREIKRVMAHLGLDVTRLIRVSYGPFQLGDLAEGAVEEVKLKMLREQLGKSLAELAGVDFGASLRETTPAEEQERRERIEKRPRKHVSTLRMQRDEQIEKGPRARITRSATADRKGRAVAVERVALVRPRRGDDKAAPQSRNAKRFSAMRGDARRRPDQLRVDAGRRDAPERVAGAERPRDDRRNSGERTAPRFERSRGEDMRRERPARERQERAPRENSEGKRFERGAGERPRPAARDNVKSFEQRGRSGPSDRQERSPRKDGRRFDRQSEERKLASREGATSRGPRQDGAGGSRGGADPNKRPPRKGPPRSGGAPRTGPPRKGPPRKPRGA